MKNWFQENGKGFVSGILATILAGSLVVGALANMGETRQIEVLVGGISIYVDGILQDPKNVNGESVQPIAWKGSTYLPVRALTNMLTNKEVNWDQEKMSVYIGKRPGEHTILLSSLNQYSHSNNNTWECPMLVGDNAIYRILDREYAPDNRLAIGKIYSNTNYANGSYENWTYSDVYCTYVLNGKYRSLSGKFVIPYMTVGTTAGSGVGFYKVDQHGKETLLGYFYTRTGDEPVDVKINLSGVDVLKIRSYKTDKDWPYEFSDFFVGSLCDVTLELP